MTETDRLRVLLFDLDGTIADTHGLILKCYDHAVQIHIGRPGIREVWLARIGLPLDDILNATYVHYGMALPTTEEMAAVKQTYRDHMRESDGDIQAFAGMPETLAELKSRGYRLGVITTKHRAMAVRHLERLDLLNVFEQGAVVCGDMCAACKPAPEPFWLALELLKVAPDQAAMIGDSRQDILGAKAAGVLAVAACWGTDNRATLLAASPDRVAETPSDLLEFQIVVGHDRPPV